MNYGKVPAFPLCFYAGLLISTSLLLAMETAHAQTPAADYKAYPLRHTDASSIEAALRAYVQQVDGSAAVMVNADTNEVLVRGGNAAHRAAADLLRIADRPSETTTMGGAASPATGGGSASATVTPEADMPTGGRLRTYRCKPGEAEQLAGQLSVLFADRPDVRIAASPQGDQILVYAPEDAGAIVAEFFQARQAGEPIPRGGVPMVSGGRGDLAEPPSPARNGGRPATPAAPAIQRNVRLTNITGAEAEASLRNLFGTRLATSDAVRYRFTSARQETVALVVDKNRHEVHLDGAPVLVGQFARLIEALDQRETDDEVIRVMPIRQADPEKMRKAVDAIRDGYSEPKPKDRPAALPVNPQSSVRPGAHRDPAMALAGAILSRNSRSENSAFMRDDAVTTVAYMQEMGGAAGGESSEVFGGESSMTIGVPTGDSAEVEGSDQDVYALAPDVAVDMFPDLDVVLLRGSSTAVKRLADIIAAIEEISREREPQIEVYYLKHVECVSLTTLISQVYPAYLAQRQGIVTVLPLVKPNALLVVGWGDAVVGAKDLIREIDQPTAPGAGFQVFKLKHISAIYASATLQQLYPMAMGMSPRLRAIPDARTNSIIVAAAPRDLLEAQAVIEQIDVDKSEAVSQVQLFKLKNSLAQDMAQVLQNALRPGTMAQGGRMSMIELLTVEAGKEELVRSGLLDSVTVTPNPRTNTLIVSGPQESMPLIKKLVDILDQPSSVAQIKVFKMVHGDAAAMVTMLQDLIPSQIAGMPSAQLPGAAGEEGLVPVRFSIDTRTNSIIAAGSEGDLMIIQALLLKLDEQDLRQREQMVFRLKNSPADAVAATVNTYLESRRLVQNAAPGVFSPYEQLDSEVIVVPEMVSNSLLISATPEEFDEIVTLVEDLDAQPAQVVVQVLIAEVQLNDTDEFGIELGLQDSILFDRSIDGTGGTTIPGFLFNSQTNNNSLGNSGSNQALQSADVVGTQGITNLAVNRINSELGFGGFVFSASSEAVSVLIRALKECRRLEVLSRPQVTTLDNQSAFIQVGKRVPRITSARTDTRGSTNNVALDDVGLILGVTPRVSPDGKVVMDVDAEKSSLDPVNDGVPVAIIEGQVIRSPSISVTTAQTTVSAASGETIIIGGLITTNESEAHRRVPVLSDIPVLGHLFRYDYKASQRTELLIILTPRVIATDVDNRELQQREMSRLSWCLRDIQDLHGDIGIYDIQAPTPAYGDTPMLGPNEMLDLEELRPLESVPAERRRNRGVPRAPVRESVPEDDGLLDELPTTQRPVPLEPTPARVPEERALPMPPDQLAFPPTADLTSRGRNEAVGMGAAPIEGMGMYDLPVDQSYSTTVSYGEANRPTFVRERLAQASPTPGRDAYPSTNYPTAGQNVAQASVTDASSASVIYGSPYQNQRGQGSLRDQFAAAMANRRGNNDATESAPYSDQRVNQAGYRDTRIGTSQIVFPEYR